MFPIETISAKMLDYYVGRSDELIIDLRDTVSYHKSHVKGAVNVPYGELDNGYKIRRAAIDLNVPLITNARLASAFINAFCTMTVDDIAIKSWEEYK